MIGVRSSVEERLGFEWLDLGKAIVVSIASHCGSIRGFCRALESVCSLRSMQKSLHTLSGGTSRKEALENHDPTEGPSPEL
jgi:hypothetical protein